MNSKNFRINNIQGTINRKTNSKQFAENEINTLKNSSLTPQKYGPKIQRPNQYNTSERQNVFTTNNGKSLIQQSNYSQYQADFKKNSAYQTQQRQQTPQKNQESKLPNLQNQNGTIQRLNGLQNKNRLSISNNDELSAQLNKFNELDHQSAKKTYNIMRKSSSKFKSMPQQPNVIQAASVEQKDQVSLIEMVAVRSRPGSLPGKPIKTNQDNYIMIKQNIMNQQNFSLFSVADGHGVNGHLVSAFIKQNLPLNINKNCKHNMNSEQMQKAITETYVQTNTQLNNQSYDTNFSGSTLVSVLICDRHIYCANLGDSRAILAKQRGTEWIVQPLSQDQKPDDPKEKKRILEKGGRVEPFRDYNGEFVGPHRVWLKKENIPGLAMSRSMGDQIAASVGVIQEPEIFEYDIKDEDRFIVIASDGVWEFLSNAQVVNLVVPHFEKNQPDAACEKLVKQSVICWKREDEVVDDITVIILFLKGNKL